MPYTKKDYPDTMKNLPKTIRNKAIDIVNALIDEEDMDESIAIPTAISQAKDWAENRGIDSGSSETDDKVHGKDQYVYPHEKGWAVKTEGNEEATRVFELKKDALDFGKQQARKYSADLTIQTSDGKIADKYSFNKS